MQSWNHAICARAVGAAGGSVLAIALAFTFGAAQAQDKTYVMKVTLPTINDAPHQFAKDFAALVEKDSGGRIKGEVYPASQLGSIPRQIEGTQCGAIQVAPVPPEFFVGVDERFEVMATPGLAETLEHGQRIASDPQVLKLMLKLGAEKGLHGAGLMMAQPTCIISKTPLRHLADFKGKKIRIFASKFQSVAFERLGVTPVAMSLGDVLPALQQGAIDGAVSGMGPIANMHFVDTAKYVTMTNQPAIFIIAVVNQKWYDSLPKDLQQIVDNDAATESVAINPIAIEFRGKTEASYSSSGGELIRLSPDEQSALMKMLSNVGAEVSQSKPELAAA